VSRRLATSTCCPCSPPRRNPGATSSPGSTPRLREAFLLREWQGLSYAEIAERLDTSRSAVETLIFRARKMLAQQLEQPAVRRVREALGIAPLLNLLRGLVGGTPAVVKVAGAVVVLAGAGVAVQPLVTPSHSTPPAATTARPPAPAAPAAYKPTAHRPVARQRGMAGTSPASTTHAAQVRVPVTPGAPPVQASTPAASAPAAAPSSSSSPATPSRGGPTLPATPAVQVPPLEPPPVPSITAPALPVTPPALPPTPPLETPAVPAATVPNLPTVPSVTVSSSLP
jgi:hypothetical protein